MQLFIPALLGFAPNTLCGDLGAKLCVFVQYLALWRPGKCAFMLNLL